MVDDVEDFKGLYGLRGKPIRVDGPTWVDSLVTILTDPFVSWLLLFVGLFMLVLELKLPGIGLPAITSALAFLLFFWSHYLSGTADQLEIILFLVGMVCLALELFVFPGFGVFGMSGVLLILTQHRDGEPHVRLADAGVRIPRDGLHADPGDGGDGRGRRAGRWSWRATSRRCRCSTGWSSSPSPGRASAPTTRRASRSTEGYDSLAFLIGETGRTTTMLRPTGKARFGELLVDVTADGFFIEPDSLVEVVDVQGSRVIVKQLGA